MEIKIRNEETKDIEQVRAILRATFSTEAESKLVDALRTNSRAIISLVAVSNDQVLGHILFSPVSTTPPNQVQGIGLAPVAVRPNVQSHGIGSQLIREGLCLSKELGYDYCVVLGNPRYYRRFGFEKASSFGAQNEYGVDDGFMVIQFSERITLHGMIRYAPEFSFYSV
jgi:putative acetyltransferase